MKKTILILTIGILITFVCNSCEGEEFYDEESTDLYNIKNYAYYNGNYLSAQGCCISDSLLYRFFNSGYCQIYKIRNSNALTLEGKFPLASYSTENHSNCAQYDSKDSLVYLTGASRQCNVEKITKQGSTLIQTITLEKTNLLGNDYINIILGDDDFLWAFGSNGTNLCFYKFNKPQLIIPNVTLTDYDVLDFWTVPDYNYDTNVWQGGKKYGNNLLFLFGNESSSNHIEVYNTNTHNKVLDYYLNSTISLEPEDCDFFGDDLIIVNNGGVGINVIKDFRVMLE